MTFGSLFAGIGGLDLGLERAGMTCKWQVEIDDYATKVLERHWPDVRRWRDITTFPPDAESIEGRDIGKNFADGAGRKSRGKSRQNRGNGISESWRVDLICGGFPCQDISYAGKGAGLRGERSGLFFEAVRVIRILRPRFVLLENVAALLSRGLPDVLGTLASLGFDAEWHCIPAAAVGAPHIRDRVFILAYSVRTVLEPRPRGRRVREMGKGVSKSTKEAYHANSQGLAVRQGQDTEGTRAVIRPVIERDDWWSVEPDVGRVANGVSHRMDRLRGLGNAVVPQVAEWIGKRIMEVNHVDRH